MFNVKVSSDDMKDRLDANFYRPEYLEIEHKLEQLGSTTLGSLCNGVECGPFGGNAIADDLYAEQGIAFIRPVNISSHVFDESSLVKVPEQLLIDNKLKIYNGTNLYFGRVGDPCVAVIDRKTSISPNIIVAKTNAELADPYYLWAFGACTFGLKQLLRQLKTVAQPTTSTDAVRNLNVFNASLDAQKYIGNKVRQAEQLRAWAKQVVTSLRREFENLYRPISHYDSFKRMSYPIRPDQLFEVLTPASYPPHIEKYFEENPNVTLGEICSQIYIGKTLASVESREGVKQATSRSCSGLFLKQPMNLVERKGNVDPLAKKDILLTNAAHDKNYIGKDVSFNHSDELILPSAKVLVIRLKECGIPASYVHAYLMTEAGYTQWQAIVRGISAGIHPSDVARIRIPVPDNRAQLETMAIKADDLYIQAGLAQEVSRLLTIAAKTLVEALIEGQLNVQQLIQAQQALDDGDNSLDQAILSKLSSEGYAIEGATPLFSDIDELYRLLGSAAQAEIEE